MGNPCFKRVNFSAEAIRRSSWLICDQMEKSNGTHTQTQLLYSASCNTQLCIYSLLRQGFRTLVHSFLLGLKWNKFSFLCHSMGEQLIVQSSTLDPLPGGEGLACQIANRPALLTILFTCIHFGVYLTTPVLLSPLVRSCYCYHGMSCKDGMSACYSEFTVCECTHVCMVCACACACVYACVHV